MGRRSRAPHPPFLQASVTNEVATPGVEQAGARRARPRRDDSRSAVVRRGVSRPAGPARDSQYELRDLLLPGSERQGTGWGQGCCGGTKATGLKNITRRSTGKRSTVPRGLNAGPDGHKRANIAGIAGLARPARPVCDKPVSARTRWNLFGDHGVVQGGPGPARCRGRLRSGDARRLPWRGPGSEQQSESCHWATRFTGPLQVSTPRLPERTGRSMPEPGNAAR